MACPKTFRVDGGDSLGLSIVRDLVTGQLGGSMSMETDNGTVVTLAIPLIQASR